jgi:hypothetical protein
VGSAATLGDSGLQGERCTEVTIDADLPFGGIGFVVEELDVFYEVWAEAEALAVIADR